MNKMDKEKIFERFYNFMVKYNINMLTLQTDSIEVTDDFKKIYNNNLEKYYELTDYEIKTLKKLKYITFEEFNNYYCHRISEIEKNEFEKKEKEKEKRKNDFDKKYYEFYGEY
jgi:hypothetical protein